MKQFAPGLESSVPGLHFLGAPAAWSFGPIMRFASGGWYARSAAPRVVPGRGSGRQTASAPVMATAGEI